MKQADKNSPSSFSKPNGLSKYAYYSGIGFQMIAIIGIFTFIGYKIDAAQESDTPIWTALCSLTGVVISIYFVIRAVTKRK